MGIDLVLINMVREIIIHNRAFAYNIDACSQVDFNNNKTPPPLTCAQPEVSLIVHKIY